MHQNEVYNAVDRVLVRSLANLAKTPEGQTEVQKMVRKIMTEISESNIRFVGVREGLKRPEVCPAVDVGSNADKITPARRLP